MSPYNNQADDVVTPELFEWFVENMPVPVLVTAGPELVDEGYDVNEVLYVNNAFCQMCGYDPDELLGERPELLQGPETDRRILDRVSDQVSNGEGFVAEVVNYRKNGEEYRVRWRADPIRNNSGVTHWVSIHEDVTEDPMSGKFTSESL